jgi:hypothetical protein
MANLDIKLFEKVYVGFQKRNTESGSPLGFLTPWGEDSAARGRMATVDKWSSSSKLQAVILDNIPVSGFRVSDSARRNGWNGGNTVIQIEDPRGFELQITVDNMIQIMSGNLILDGEIKVPCVWGRDGKDNILLPTNSEPYMNAIENTERLKQTFSMRSVKLGNKIELKDGRVGIYYGAYYQVMRKHYSDNAKRGRQFEKVVIDENKVHLVYITENKAVNDFKPNLEVLKAVKVSRQIDATTITVEEAERHVNEHLTDRTTYRSCIGYTSTSTLEYKIITEPTTSEVLRDRQGLKNSWSTGKTIFIAKNVADNLHLLCDGSVLIDMNKPNRYVPGMGYLTNDDRIYGRLIDMDTFILGDFEILQAERSHGSNLKVDANIRAYAEDDLEYYQPYVIYTSEKTGIEYKMPY